MPTKTIETNPERKALEALRADLAVAIPLTVKSTYSCLKGDVLGVITADGLARRRAVTQATGTGFSTASPTGQVVDASVFKAGDVLTNAAGQNLGTVASIDTAASPDTVTLSANSGQNVASGANVLASDGSQVAKAIADKESDGVGDTPVNAFIAGLLVEADLRGLDSTAKTELGGVSVAGGIFKF